MAAPYIAAMLDDDIHHLDASWGRALSRLAPESTDANPSPMIVHGAGEMPWPAGPLDRYMHDDAEFIFHAMLETATEVGRLEVTGENPSARDDLDAGFTMLLRYSTPPDRERLDVAIKADPDTATAIKEPAGATSANPIIRFEGKDMPWPHTDPDSSATATIASSPWPQPRRFSRSLRYRSTVIRGSRITTQACGTSVPTSPMTCSRRFKSTWSRSTRSWVGQRNAI